MSRLKGTDGSAVAPVDDNSHSGQVCPGSSIKGSLTARANAAEGDPARV